MEYIIKIKDVDSEAKLDIDYFINKYLKKVSGIVDTNVGGGVIGEKIEVNFIIKRN